MGILLYVYPLIKDQPKMLFFSIKALQRMVFYAYFWSTIQFIRFQCVFMGEH